MQDGNTLVLLLFFNSLGHTQILEILIRYQASSKISSVWYMKYTCKNNIYHVNNPHCIHVAT